MIKGRFLYPKEKNEPSFTKLFKIDVVPDLAKPEIKTFGILGAAFKEYF